MGTISTNSRSSHTTPNSKPKSRRLQPIIYTGLFTSNPANHQATKRVKGLLGYSEYYNGNQNKFHSLRKLLRLHRRDYRKARELSLNLWHREGEMAFLEKFLKVQTNLKKIRINVMKTESQQEEILEKLCKVFGKLSRINTVHFGFPYSRDPVDFQKAGYLMRKLPKLKDISIMQDGKELDLFSLGLFSERFHSQPKESLKSGKGVPTNEGLIKRNRKVHELDTIRVNTTKFPEEFLGSIASAISKLANFRELNLCYSKSSDLPVKPTLKILERLLSAAKLQVIQIGLEVDGIERASILKHPVFKAQSLKRVHISLKFYTDLTPENLREIMEHLQKIPKLYQLSLNFDFYYKMNDEIAKRVQKQISGLMNLRKLSIVFGSYCPVTISDKQIGSIIRSIFKMSLLEELDLQLPIKSLDLAGYNEGKSLGEDIQGLPKLKKMRLILREYEEPAGNAVLGLLVLVGRCYRLRDLELELSPKRVDWEGVTQRFKGYVGKLKDLQTLKLHISRLEDPLTLKTLRVWVKDVFLNLPSLQKVYLEACLLVQDDHDSYVETRLLESLKDNEEHQKVILNVTYVN